MIHDDDVYALIFTSDLALEVRSEFVDRTSVGLSVRDASIHVLGKFADLLRDPNDGPVIIIALAALQLDHGTLMTSVQGAAIELIESREAERAWRSSDSETMQERRQLLSRLAETLRTAPTVDDD